MILTDGVDCQETVLNSNGIDIPVFSGNFWTSKQRASCSLHEISYRACFKANLPNFFIERLTSVGDTVYDPFSGRGTTAIEAALMSRNVIANDINPLSSILCLPRLFPPHIRGIESRLYDISEFETNTESDIDLSMFYHPDTLKEIIRLKNWILIREEAGLTDDLDIWIRMVATNRLTGHSVGYFSVYSLPPNQATSQESQKKINAKLGNTPEYKSVEDLILKKSKSLLSDVDNNLRSQLRAVDADFLCNEAHSTPEIDNNSVDLVVTSPPFMNIVDYAGDNWLRCWFNGIDIESIKKKMTLSKTVEDWSMSMSKVMIELFRIIKPGGHVAFEVGEVNKGKIKLETLVVPIAIQAGFSCLGILINDHRFTKTSNIWGVDNNSLGTNSNRIVVLRKP